MSAVTCILTSVTIALGMISCSNDKNGQSDQTDYKNVKSETPKNDQKESKIKKKIPDRVTIYRFEGFPKSTAIALRDELRKTFPDVTLEEKELRLPAAAYLKERNRYRAEGLLEALRSHKHGDAVLGLTNKIIYHPNDISPTFGVMGLSWINSHTCVASSQIPKNGQFHKPDNFVKLSLHELGHAFGLPHCPDEHCYMVDAEHKLKFTQTTDFCEKCKTKLKNDGWNLK